MHRYFAHIVLTVAILCSCASNSTAAAKAQNIGFLLSQVRTSTTSLAGGQVYAYTSGTSTPQTIWLDRDKGSEAANPYMLDSNGTAQLYADGLYRIVIKDASEVTKYDRDGLSFVDPSATYTVSDTIYESLNAAITAIGSTPTTLEISTPNFPLTGNTVVPLTMALKVTYPGSINQGAYSLTINGPFSAGDYKVFAGTGAVVFGSLIDYLSVEWFGAIGDYNGTTGTDNTVAFNRTAAAGVASWNPYSYGINSPVGGYTIKLKPVNYLLTGEVAWSGNLQWEGTGPVESSGGTRVTWNNAALTKGFHPTAPTTGGTFGIRHMSLRGATMSPSAYLIYASNNANGAQNNSVRISDIQTYTNAGVIAAEGGDDWKIGPDITFDINNGSTIVAGFSSLFTSSNISGNTFYNNAGTLSMLSFPVGFGFDGLTFDHNNVYGAIGNVGTVLSALAPLAQNLKVSNNTVKNAKQLLDISPSTNSNNISVTGNINWHTSAVTASAPYINIGASANTLSFGLNKYILGIGAQPVIDAHSTVNAILDIQGESFISISGTNDPLYLPSAFNGALVKVRNNTFSGYANPQLSEKIITVANAITPGTIPTLGTYSSSQTVKGSRVGSTVTICDVSSRLPAGITRSGIARTDTVKIFYSNGTAAGIAVPAHDILIEAYQ